MGLVIRINPDLEKATEIREGLKHTGGQCPCVPKYAWNADTACMCKAFREQAEPGLCHCMLYEKIEVKI